MITYDFLTVLSNLPSLSFRDEYCKFEIPNSGFRPLNSLNRMQKNINLIILGGNRKSGSVRFYSQALFLFLDFNLFCSIFFYTHFNLYFEFQIKTHSHNEDIFG